LNHHRLRRQKFLLHRYHCHHRLLQGYQYMLHRLRHLMCLRQLRMVL
jgi:hypothetical protein